jgi:hypothetical protein
MYWYNFHISILVHITYKENLKFNDHILKALKIWRKFIIILMMTRIITVYLWDMFSLCIKVIWKPNDISLNMLFEAMSV